MSSNLFSALKKDHRLIKHFLAYPDSYVGWSLQGFGMLRLYLTPEIRLHVWDSKYRVPNVSMIHTHPWDFESHVVSGLMENTRFLYSKSPIGVTHQFSTIKCGPGGGVRSEPEPVALVQQVLEAVEPGQDYFQAADEIHISYPKDGTVTLVERTFKQDTEHAKVFWPLGQSWVSAEPRPATWDEVRAICGKALDLSREFAGASCLSGL